MKKKIITIIGIGIFAAVCIFAAVLKLREIRQSDADSTVHSGKTNQSQETGQLQATFPYETYGEDSKVYQEPIQEEQICQTDESVCVMGNKSAKDGRQQGAEVVVTEPLVTRKLPDGYELNERTYEEFGGAILSDDGTFLKDFYYLNVHIKYTSLSNFARQLLPSSLSYIFINDENIASDIFGEYSYAGKKFGSSAYAYRETDDKNLLALAADSKMVQQGEFCEYDACYIISEQMLENNQLYLCHQWGGRPDRELQDNNQRYVRIDLKNCME